MSSPSLQRRLVVVAINLCIALLHLVDLRSHLPEPWRVLHASYFADLVMPFGAYFLLCMGQEGMPLLARWPVRLGLAFGLPALAETLQFLGVWALGVTFDPLDYAMYAAGAGSAALVDRQLLRRYAAFWRMPEDGGPDAPAPAPR
ncbi:MAG: hypothetical protein GX557_08415 [Chloroflexi bacterium]|nr:hypothetical protein [Chloroflexota bacterium]